MKLQLFAGLPPTLFGAIYRALDVAEMMFRKPIAFQAYTKPPKERTF
jgi:hypothetical protein